MSVATLFSRAILRDFNGASYVDMEWTSPVDAAGRPLDVAADEHVAILRPAEDALNRDSDPAKAIELLAGIDLGSDEFARKLAVEATIASGDPDTLIGLVGIPTSQAELIHVVDAYANAGYHEMAETQLPEHSARLGITQSLQGDMAKKTN